MFGSQDRREWNIYIIIPSALLADLDNALTVSLKSTVSYKSKPRYLYIGTISNSWSPYLKSTVVRSSDTLLKCTTLDLCSLTLSFHLLDQSYSEFSIVCRPSSVSDIKTTSSAYNMMLRVSSFDMVTPRRNPFISGTKSLINRANNVGASVSPWRTPAVCANQSVMRPFTLTQLSKLLYIVWIIENICPCTPAADNLYHR